MRVLPVLSLMVLSMAACAAPEGEEASDEAAVSELKAYWADAKKLDLGDLSRVAVGFATTQLNDQLALPNVGARFEPPAVFAATAEPSKVLPDGSEIKALDTVVSGLLARYGERELGTQVNAARLAHLEASNDDYYVESAFTARAGIDRDFSFVAGGVDLRLGIDAGAEVKSRVILATRSDSLPSLLRAPLAAAKEMRGFVYPRSLQDIRGMKPGEMFALRGLGKLGGNFGLGVPLLIAEPTGGLAYRIVVSAGAAAVVSGQLDVQLVRLGGDEVVVDVGVENGKAMSVRAGISDAWGIKGLCDDGKPCLRPVDLGVAQVDLQALVEKAVEQRLNKYLSFSVQASASRESSRVSLSRFRFHLDRGNADEVEKALASALRFDVRLAQALHNRDLGESAPAVTAEVDAVRAATVSSRNFGFEALGMNVYHRNVVENEGTFVVQTPDGVKSVLFDTVDDRSGVFQTEHGFARTALGAQTVDARDPTRMRSEANLFLQAAVGDSHMDDNLLIDNLDALIASIAGPAAAQALDPHGLAIEKALRERCPLGERVVASEWDRCAAAAFEPLGLSAKRKEALQAFEQHLGPLPEASRKLARSAAEVRMVLHSAGLHGKDALAGAGGSITVDARFDDEALSALAAQPRERYRAALVDYLATASGRRDVARDVARRDVEASFGAGIDRMSKVFEERARAYRRVADAEKLVPVALAGKRYVASPVGVRFAVDNRSAAKYESAILESTSQDRARAAAALFDGLRDAAGDLAPGFFERRQVFTARVPLYDEHAALYPMLALVPHREVDLAMDLRVSASSTFFVERERFAKAGLRSTRASAKGEASSLVTGGMFDIDRVLEGR